MPDSIPIISHTSVPTLSLPSDHTPTPTTSTSSTTGTSSLKVKRSRPRLLKRLSAQSLLTRSKHSNGSSVSLVESSSHTVEKESDKISETVPVPAVTATAKAPNQSVTTTSKGIGSTSLPTRKPSFSLSTPSITIATCQKEVVTSTAMDMSSSTSSSTQQQQQTSSSSSNLSSSLASPQQEQNSNKSDKKNQHRKSSIIMPSPSSSSSPETPQPPHPIIPPTITTTTCDSTATSSFQPSSSILTSSSSSSSSFSPSQQHTPLKRTQSTSSLLSLASSSRINSLASSEESESDHYSTEEDDDNDEKKNMQHAAPQQHRSLPLLSQRTVHQLVPGSVAAQCDYPLANTKRNMEFHTLFRSVPELDPLIEVYKCALQKEILLQGHIYITEHHLCFNANIFGWVTNLVIAFSDITSIEKRMTAMIIPNGIQVSTVHAKHIFASFMSRDMAFDQMYKVWQMHHDETAQVHTSLQPRSNSDFAIKDEDEFSDSVSVTDTSSSEKESDEAIVKTPHCQCDQHLSQIALDATYTATVGVIHELLFQTNFFPKALKKYEGCQDLTVSKWDGHTRESYYKRQLGSTEDVHIRCFRKDELVAIKIPYYCAVESTVRAPDTPMGAAICLRIRTCMSRVTSTKVRVYITFQIESSQSSPIKTLIENDIFTSQKQFHQHLDKMIRSKTTRTRIEKMMKIDRHNNDKNDHDEKERNLNIKTRWIRKTVSYIQNTTDCGVSSFISVVSSIFHVLFSLNGPQMMALSMCIALLTNVLMAYRIASISDKLGKIEELPSSSKASWHYVASSPSKSSRKHGFNYNTHGIYQLEQSIDTIHEAMFQLQKDIRNQNGRLHRLRHL